jgi:hypothetical protein
LSPYDSEHDTVVASLAEAARRDRGQSGGNGFRSDGARNENGVSGSPR